MHRRDELHPRSLDSFLLESMQIFCLGQSKLPSVPASLRHIESVRPREEDTGREGTLRACAFKPGVCLYFYPVYFLTYNVRSV